MADTLLPDHFRALSAPLAVELPEGEIALAVESVDLLPPHRLRAEPFSVVLRGPRAPMLRQATYAVRHPSLGRLELFLVPLGPDAQGPRYEVTFN